MNIFIFVHQLKSSMLKKVFPIIIFLAFLFFAGKSFAGMGPIGPPTGPPPCWPPPCTIPIDGGISILIAAGAALGGKKLLNLRKKGNQ